MPAIASPAVPRINGQGIEASGSARRFSSCETTCAWISTPNPGWPKVEAIVRCSSLPLTRLPISATLPFSQPGGSRAMDSAG